LAYIRVSSQAIKKNEKGPRTMKNGGKSGKTGKESVS
jgi:hypothetical protein